MAIKLSWLGDLKLSTLGKRCGGLLRADSVEHAGCRPLDVFEALAQELRVAAVQADVILRGASGFEAD
jgi:hypothetical protein